MFIMEEGTDDCILVTFQIPARLNSFRVSLPRPQQQFHLKRILSVIKVNLIQVEAFEL